MEHLPVNLYLIPGMGTDHRLFHAYKFDENVFNPVPLKWPDHRGCKGLADFANRLCEQIDTRNPCMIAGFSMGGMLAQCIASSMKVDGLFLISSATGPTELNPLLFRLYNSGLVRLITDWSIRFVTDLPLIFNRISDPGNRRLFKTMIRETGAAFLRWQIDAVMNWPGATLPENTHVFRIHGTRDFVIPFSRLSTPCQKAIAGVGHEMAINHPDVVTAFIHEMAMANRHMEQPD